MSVKMTAQFDITFDGAFDNCYVGCDSCDFISRTHTKYKDGKATGMELKVECQNAEQCRHLMEHLQNHHGDIVIKQSEEETWGEEYCARQLL